VKKKIAYQGVILMKSMYCLLFGGGLHYPAMNLPDQSVPIIITHFEVIFSNNHDSSVFSPTPFHSDSSISENRYERIGTRSGYAKCCTEEKKIHLCV
jgi:hypothetical protein